MAYDQTLADTEDKLRTAEETLTELQAWLKERADDWLHDANVAHRMPEVAQNCLVRRNECLETLDWLETKRSGNG